MEFSVQLTDKSAGSIADFKQFCRLFRIDIVQEGKLHYAHEFLVKLTGKSMFVLSHQSNALHAYSHLHKVMVQWVEAED